MLFHLRVFAAGLIAGLSVLMPVHAEEWPQRPIKLIVGTAPGGLVDIVGRIFAKHLTDELGQSFIVEDRPGAGGNIAAKLVASASPDGYTLLLTGNNHAVNPTLLPNPGFDYVQDFEPVAMLAQSNMILAASPTFAANSVTEAIDLAKRNPGSVNMAISPIGTPNHLGAELLMQLADIKLTIVPYPGVSAAIPDLMTNRIQLTLGAIPSILSYVQDRRLKALAVSRLSRSSLVPQIPTVDESGLRGYDVNAWTCVMAPRGTPVSVVERLNTTIAKLLVLPEVQHELAGQGAEPAPMSPKTLGAYIAQESSKWAAVLQKAQIRE